MNDRTHRNGWTTRYRTTTHCNTSAELKLIAELKLTAELEGLAQCTLANSTASTIAYIRDTTSYLKKNGSRLARRSTQLTHLSSLWMQKPREGTRVYRLTYTYRPESVWVLVHSTTPCVTLTTTSHTGLGCLNHVETRAKGVSVIVESNNM